MNRLVGVAAMVVILYLALVGSFPSTRTASYHQDLARYFGFYGVLALGVGLLIVAGGIDLSIGSLVGLAAVCFGKLLARDVSPVSAALLIVAAGAVLGLAHGLLVTRLRLQPFLVTLCGLFMYRGLARSVADGTVNLPTSEARPDVDALRRLLVSGTSLGVSHQLLLLLVLAAVLALVLHGSVYGRYLYAIGFNEPAARYAGIATGRYRVLAYVICSTLAGLGGVLFLLGFRQAQPSSAGQLLELYAITGAVLGGCSLRGGEGTVLGILLGAAVLPLLQEICRFSSQIGSDLEYTVIGAALLLGTIADEMLKRRTTRST